MEKIPEDTPWEEIKRDLLKRNQRWMKHMKGSATVNGALRTIVLTCLDSRVSVDYLFDAVPGEILLMKNAGNEITDDVFRSLVLAIYEIGARHVIILGHTHCGTGFKDNPTLITHMKEKMGEEVIKGFEEYSGKSIVDFLGLFEAGNNGIVRNVHEQCEILKNKIEKIMPQNWQPNIVPALYDVETGEVSFL